MSLSASQQHALDAIGDGLRHGDPRLATMFAVFTRLTRQESMPAQETLPLAHRWWASGQWRANQRSPALRLLIPLLVAATLSLLIVSILANPSRQRECSHASGRSAAARLMVPVACPPVGAAQVAK
jgi:hypothetical protein